MSTPSCSRTCTSITPAARSPRGTRRPRPSSSSRGRRSSSVAAPGSGRAIRTPALGPLLESSGRLEIVDGDTSATLGDGYRFHVSDGHTPGLLLTEVAMPAGPIVFAADLIPGRAWVHLPITMGYDRFPELLIDEKARLLAELVARGGRLFFTHDPEVALSTVSRDAQGKYVPVDDRGDVRDLAA
jgi:glyoxylase-like metal-dependent hydrolase (beta-lactamase superfamily II)